MNMPVRNVAMVRRVVSKNVAALLIVAASALAVSALAVLTTAAASTAGGTPFRPTDPGFVVAELPGGSSRARDGSARRLMRATIPNAYHAWLT